MEYARIIPTKSPFSQSGIDRRAKDTLAEIGVLRQMIDFLQLYFESTEDVFAPLREALISPCIRLHQHLVVLVSVIAEDRCGVENALRRSHSEAILHQQRIGEEPYRTPIPIGEGVYPYKAVVRDSYLDEVISGIIVTSDEVNKFVHIAIDSHRCRGEMIGLRDDGLPCAECPWGAIPTLPSPRGKSCDDTLM